MLGKDKNSPKRKAARQEKIVKRTKKSSNTRSAIVDKSKSTASSGNKKALNKNAKEASEKTTKKQVKKKKVKKPLSAKQIKVRNIFIAFLTVVIIGGLCGFVVYEYSNQQKAQKQQQQQQQNVDGITDQQMITAANAYLGNEQYNFKSVIKRTVNSNGNLVATLLAAEENKGTYQMTQVSVMYNVSNNTVTAISMQAVNQQTTTSSTIENSTEVQNKLDVTYKVLDYLKGTGMNINDTSWAMDITADQTIGNQTGYLVDVYKVQGNLENPIEWIFVSNSGQMYNAGTNGQGPLSPI